MGQGILPAPARLLAEGTGHFLAVNGPDGVEGVSLHGGGEERLAAGPVAGNEETKPGLAHVAPSLNVMSGAPSASQM